MPSVRCIINGRFLGAPATGVQRVATQIVEALATAKEKGEAWTTDMAFELALPKALATRAAALRLPVRVMAPLAGNMWEQLTLPARSDAEVILNLCNMGPLVARRCVTMIHDAQVHQSPESYSPAFRRWYSFAQQRIGRRHAAILTVSEFSARELATVGICDRAEPVYNGGDHITQVTPDDTVISRLGLTAGRYVIAPSSTMPHKNIALLLRVFADPRLEGVPLVLYGAADRAAFVAMGSTPPQATIFAGRIDDGAMRSLLENALCLAFPSLTEGFGLPPLEAMQLGCPVVTTGCGAVREVCGDAALYAGPCDASAWVGHIVRLADNEGERAALSRVGRHRARDFTWTSAARRVVEVVRRVAGSGGS